MEEIPPQVRTYKYFEFTVFIRYTIPSIPHHTNLILIPYHIIPYHTIPYHTAHRSKSNSILSGHWWLLQPIKSIVEFWNKYDKFRTSSTRTPNETTPSFNQFRIKYNQFRTSSARSSTELSTTNNQFWIKCNRFWNCWSDQNADWQFSTSWTEQDGWQFWRADGVLWNAHVNSRLDINILNDFRIAEKL